MTHYRLPQSKPAHWLVEIVWMMVMAAAVVLFLIF